MLLLQTVVTLTCHTQMPIYKSFIAHCEILNNLFFNSSFISPSLRLCWVKWLFLPTLILCGAPWGINSERCLRKHNMTGTFSSDNWNMPQLPVIRQQTPTTEQRRASCFWHCNNTVQIYNHLWHIIHNLSWMPEIRITAQT